MPHVAGYTRNAIKPLAYYIGVARVLRQVFDEA